MDKRICTIAECGKKHYAKDLCVNHYALLRRNGAPAKVKGTRTCDIKGCQRPHYGNGLCRKHWRAQRATDGEPCSLEGCSDPVEARAWCSKHYNRWKRHGDPRHETEQRTCTIPGCESAHRGNGYCSMHYYRDLRHGDPLYVYVHEPKPKKRCAVVDCHVDAYCKGYCSDHYTRLRNHGDPNHKYPYEWVDGLRTCPACSRKVSADEWSGPYCKTCWADYQNARGHERRARLRKGSIGRRFTRTEVFKRDGWVCQICGQDIHPATNYPDPLSASLDHVKPLSRGGAHSFSNCQASHLVCNLRKHASEPAT